MLRKVSVKSPITSTSRLSAPSNAVSATPASSAAMQTTIATAPKPATVTTMRRPTSARAGKRHDREMTGARVDDHVGVDAVERAHVRGREDVGGSAGREHASVLQQHQFA